MRSDEAGRAYEAFLNQRAIPIFRQVANILRAEGFLFTVFTPAGGVRLMSDRLTAVVRRGDTVITVSATGVAQEEVVALGRALAARA